MLSISATLTFACLQGLVLCVSLIFIRVIRLRFLHPLKSYPGPWLASVTDAYGAWFAFRKTLHHQTFRDHAKYGPVMRYGPNKLVFATSAAIQDIYVNHDVSKAKSYHDGNFMPGTFNIFNVVDKEVHRQKRKVIGGALTERSMKAFEAQMRSHVDIFLQQLAQASRIGNKNSQHDQQVPILDMTERCRWLAMDIVGDLSFGCELRLQTEPTNRPMLGALADVDWRMNCYMQLGILRHLEPVAYYAAAFYGQNYFAKLHGMVQERRTKVRDDKHHLYNFLTRQSEENSEEEQMSFDEIWNEAVTFVAAGGETTSTSICATLFYLCRFPAYKRRLVSEIDNSFQNSSDIRIGPALWSCKLLRACIDEAMRVSPPGAATLWREQSPDAAKAGRPFIVDGHVVPPDTLVGVNIYTMHHTAEYFPKPFEYNPDRWLVSENEPQDKTASTMADKRAFIPFSIGSRSCAGKAMAYTEASIVLASILWYFDIEPAGETASGGDVFETLDIFSALHTGPFVRLTPRGDRCDGLL